MKGRSRKVALVLAGVLLLTAMAGLVACGSQTASLRSSQQSVTTDLSEGSTTATAIAVVSTDVPTTERTITSSTELITPPTGSTPLGWLNSDAFAAGIEMLELRNSGAYGSLPGELSLTALATKGQDTTAYQAIAEKLLSLAEKYKQPLYFDQLHVVLVVARRGEVLYDHIFQATPPTSTTSTTQPFITYYSAPRLQVTPREGVSLEMTVSKSSQGTVTLTVGITNHSSSAFYFSREDLQLYLNAVRIDPTQEGGDARTEFAAGRDSLTGVEFAPAEFDPHSAGLLYISSDPQSQGFTASDGPMQAQFAK